MKLLFFTGSRSEWGYLRPILEICKRNRISFKICASNMLILDSFGDASKEIEKDGFKINDKIFMALDGHTNTTMTKSLGILLSSFTDTLSREKPDWLILAGDRGETLIAAIAAAYMNIPIAHIQAGELSGNIDGQARHAIGKFAHLHFASNKDASNRLIKLGEQKFRIFNYGAPQLDDLVNKKYMNIDIKDLEKKYNINLKKNYIISVYHSVVEEGLKNKDNFGKYMKFINSIKGYNKIWITSNNDAGSNMIKDIFYQNRSSDDYLFNNLPRKDYLCFMKYSKMIIGNSSSGIIESSTYKIPCINVGRRQNKRFRPKNVIDVLEISNSKLNKAFNKSISKKYIKSLSSIENPYGDGRSSLKIINRILKTKINEKLIYKELEY